MIVFEAASRWYGQVIGVNDVTCEIGPGVTALLGQNGAGKSTMLKLVTGQLRPTTGTVRVFGMDPFANPDVYRKLGYCPDIDSFPEHLTGRQFVHRMARLAGYSENEAQERTGRAVELVGMEDRADRRLKGFSKGMRQRIKLAQAVVHDPDVLLLDEPLNGLDPVGRRQFMDVLHKLAESGKSVVVSSHVLFEVEQMTRSILLLHRGRLLASGDLGAIRAYIDRHPHRIRIETSEPRILAAYLISLPFVVSAQIGADGGSLEVQTRQPDAFYETLPKLVLEENVPISGLYSPDNNLEAVFQYLVTS
ncbi:MAG: ABC transporter ATP-binding protein [Armatimonadetes bacterium]|nr:ABC transporter ATP-binding protein [Armatimonadota bacterium]